MSRNHAVRIIATVRGKNLLAEGFLEIELPFVPDVNMEIHDLYTREPLFVEHVVYSVQSRKFAVRTFMIREENRKTESLLKHFVGEWEWTLTRLPEETTDEEVSEEIQDKEQQNRSIILDLLKKRGKSLPQAPAGESDSEQN